MIGWWPEGCSQIMPTQRVDRNVDGGNQDVGNVLMISWNSVTVTATNSERDPGASETLEGNVGCENEPGEGAQWVCDAGNENLEQR